jgi:hypothetical protein
MIPSGGILTVETGESPPVVLALGSIMPDVQQRLGRF